ncbi:MAG TPA: antibiotic biosynthesis monooxygenase [Ktedonobacterales bacterium]
MYARIVTVEANVDKLEELIAIYRDSIVPAARQQKGFMGARLFTNPVTGKGVSVTRWQSKEDLEAGEASGYYQEQIAKIAPMLTAPPAREIFDISVD